MKISYQWLSEYVDLHDVTPEELATLLTQAGVAVDVVESRNLGVSGVIVGEVKTCEKHPNADRLNVCQVDVGGDALSTIVCGARNVAAGQKVAVAVPGSTIPVGEIKASKIRDVMSHGMICSASELGLNTRLMPKGEDEGIYVLPADTGVGTDVAELLQLNDFILELDLTPNRNDCLSIRGVAYEVAAILGRSVSFPSVAMPSTNGASPVNVSIETEKCSEYDVQVLTGIDIASSPLWMQMRLLGMGIRPINNIVDVTNYTMLEWGQPLHAFDFTQITDGHIVVRQGKHGEQLITLDGEARDVDVDTIVIADDEKILGLAGIMGGENSEVTSKTQQIALESAAFAASHVRRAGQRLGLRSEAQQRFEKGVDPIAIRGALIRATALLQDITGAEAVGGIVHQGNTAMEAKSVSFSPARCNRLLGADISEAQMKDIFSRLGFTVGEDPSLQSQTWQIGVPSRRMDIEIEADLVEEVARLYGYDNIPSTLPIGPTTVGVRTPMQKLTKRTRETLVGAGMTEVFTYTFMNPVVLDALRLPQDSSVRNVIGLLRPLSEERTHLRTHLLPGLAQVAKHNLTHGVSGGEIFEIGRVYLPHQIPLTEQPNEFTQWAGLWFGATTPNIGERPRDFDFYDAKGAVESWLEGLGWADEVTYERASDPWLHPGRGAEVKLRDRVIGTFGELHPETASAYEIDHAVYAQFSLDILAAFVKQRSHVQKLPKYPSSRRDLAVIVDHRITADDLTGTALSVAGRLESNLLESCRVFDVYTGKGIEADHKSVAVAFIYRAEDRTLTDDEISVVEEAILRQWKERFSAVLRS